jgi:hypothetical protein
LRAERVAKWAKELLDPKTAGVAALKLEGMGPNAKAPLKAGLESPDADVRFFAAEALAYLHDGSGAEELARAAADREEFRAFALAALAASDQAGAISHLREMIGHPDPELRYGAFNALRTADPNDPFLGRKPVLVQELPEFDERTMEDPMALQMAITRARKEMPRDPFALYAVDCEGPPLIHVSNNRRSEIVVFGARQKLLTPVVLGDPSSVLVNASSLDEKLQLTRIASGGAEEADRRLESGPEVVEVVQKAATLGASYPQICSLLKSAEAQKNLEGPLYVDALPAASPGYEKAQLALEGGDAKKDAEVGRASGTKDGGRQGLFRRMLPGRKNVGQGKPAAAGPGAGTGGSK